MSILVGQRLFRVEPRHGSQPPRTSWVVVKKVGRRWAEFLPEGALSDNPRWCDRFDKETLRIDTKGFGDCGRVYASEEAYRLSFRADTLWRELQRRVSNKWQRPDKADELAILKAADALGIKLEGE